MNDAKRIAPAELDRLIDSGTVTVLDLRRDWDQSDMKIPGALRADPDGYKDYVGKLPEGKPVVAYCT